MCSDCISPIKCALCLRWIDEDIINVWKREKHTGYCEWNRILLPMGSNKRHSKHQINQHLNIRWGCELLMMLCLIPYEKSQIHKSLWPLNKCFDTRCPIKTQGPMREDQTSDCDALVQHTLVRLPRESRNETHISSFALNARKSGKRIM